jgi:hypothetical protein
LRQGPPISHIFQIAFGTRDLRARYNKHARTLKRWRDNGTLPPPDYWIGPNPYWFKTTIEANERRLVAESANTIKHA